MKRRIIAAALGLLVGTTVHAGTTSPQDYIKQSYLGLQDQQAANDSLWHMSDADHWNIDLKAGEIEFSFPDGHRVRAPIQIIGGYNAALGQFLWGWDFPGLPQSLTRDARLVKAWGQERNLERWTTRKISCTENEAWEFTAVAARLGGATGAYRVPTQAQGPVLFVTFGPIRIEGKR
jgi:hypothetical protein